MSDPATTVVQVTHCEMCNEPLDDEEQASPRKAGGWTMCDECYDADWSYRCGLCDDSEPEDQPWLATVIGSRAIEAGLMPGIYQIVRWPFFVSDMLSHRVIDRSLIRVADAPDHADESGEPLCRECAIKAIVRRTRSGRWRVTTTYYQWFRWRTKTRVYRTKAQAARRARAYVEGKSNGLLASATVVGAASALALGREYA
jgi:hypothetical protein